MSEAPLEELPACAHCSARHTPLQHSPDGDGALVCLAGHGCAVGLSLREALGHDRSRACSRPLCVRPAVARGLCEECSLVDHASRLQGLRGGDA